MSESVPYDSVAVNSHSRARLEDHTAGIRSSVVFYGVSFLCLVPLTLIANLGTYGLAEQPVIATNGCALKLDTWYIVLSSLTGLKLLIEGLRYIFVKRNN